MTATAPRSVTLPAEQDPPTRAAARRRRSLAGSVQVFLGRCAIIGAFLALWQISSGLWIEEYLISSPMRVVQRLAELLAAGTLTDDFLITAVEFFLGYGVGVSSGLVVGVVLGGWPLLGKLLEPLISALNGIPKIALAPLVILWLGIGIESKVGIAAMTVFFVMFYNVYVGLRTVPESLVNALRIMGAGRLTVVRRVALPQMTMPILAGLRAGIPFAAIGVVVGEFVAATRGLGYYIRASSDGYDSAGIFAGVALLMLLMMAMNLLVTLWERRATRWQR